MYSQQNGSPWPVPPPLLLPDAEMRMREQGIRGGIKRFSNPVFLQGLFVIGIGIILVAFNGGNPYKQMTGHVQNIYQETNVNGEYGASYLQVGTNPDDLFIFNKNALHPAWNGQLSKNEKVDIYYNDGTPKQLVALQTYGPSGNMTMKFVTTDYINNQNASPISNTGLDIGVILILLGALWAGSAVLRLVRTHRQ